MKVVNKQELKDIGIKILTKAGVPKSDATEVAEHLAEANLRGRDSHGIARVTAIVKGINMKTINPSAQVSVVRETAATALIDGNQGIGQVVALKATDMAIEKARNVGVGIVSMRNAAHIGFLAYYTERVAKQGMLGIAFTNTEPAVSPTGGMEPVLGTNPICIGIPYSDEPILVDLATSVVARGKIVDFERKGQKIPKGWALDKEGADTEDPTAALAGSLLPIAGPKGYCLAFAIDLLAGGLAGASVGTDVKGTMRTEEVANKGDLIMVIDPEKFSGGENFLGKVDRLAEQIKLCKKAPGVTQIYLPGDPELVAREKKMKEGVTLDDKLCQQLSELGG
ncbi:Ldh family oxidoreductase [Chloroflexota bacterium]